MEPRGRQPLPPGQSVWFLTGEKENTIHGNETEDHNP